MDACLAELAKLEKLTSPTGKGKAPPVPDSLDSLLQSLREARAQCEAGNVSASSLKSLSRTVDARKKDIDDRQKEVYNAVSKLGKALDKKFTASMPSYPGLFVSPESAAALDRTVVVHLLRTGQFETAETFIAESGFPITDELRSKFVDLHKILQALRAADIGPALDWTRSHRDFLRVRRSPLEFNLHRSQYIRILLSSDPPNPLPAIAYANTHLRPFFAEHSTELMRLMTCVAYLPLTKLQASPYADLASPTLHTDLAPLFAKEYCASMGMSRQVPLRVVGDIGGSGALSRIEKARKVMREGKGEWSQADELPVSCSHFTLIEIPLPPENRYHSIFACPVSKEQATETNPPMMLQCGHVLAKDSLQRLPKTQGLVKCPYCPIESNASQALEVHF
ncbi:CTLH/CRA C-terminal to lish motif domain-containing protein [Schizophyllum commune]